MKLTRVSIAGADDGVDLRELAALGEQFPFVEWGILISKKRFGEPRYPSSRWLIELPRVLGFDRLSYHLCGEFSRRVMGGDPTMVPREIKRIQLNGFGDYRLPCLVAAEMCRELDFVLQCPSIEAMQLAADLHDHNPNVAALWDQSGGRRDSSCVIDGQYPKAFSGTLRIGYAGAINELNVEDTIAALCDGTGHPTWIDLETGARDDQDRFDLAKVRRILELAAPFVKAP